MTRTLFLNFFYGLLYHLTKKQPSLSTSQIMRGVLIVFPRGYYVNIDPFFMFEVLKQNRSSYQEIVSVLITFHTLSSH